VRIELVEELAEQLLLAIKPIAERAADGEVVSEVGA
jgi:hypothetical protein